MRHGRIFASAAAILLLLLSGCAGKEELTTPETVLHLQAATGNEAAYLESNTAFFSEGQYRFCEYDKYFVYKIPVDPEGIRHYLSLNIGGQYEISVSPDGETYTVVGREPNRLNAAQDREISNVAVREFEITDHIGKDCFYVKLSDARPEDPWGSVLYRLDYQVAYAKKAGDSAE